MFHLSKSVNFLEEKTLVLALGCWVGFFQVSEGKWSFQKREGHTQATYNLFPTWQFFWIHHPLLPNTHRYTHTPGRIDSSFTSTSQNLRSFPRHVCCLPEGIEHRTPGLLRAAQVSKNLPLTFTRLEIYIPYLTLSDCQHLKVWLSSETFGQIHRILKCPIPKG